MARKPSISTRLSVKQIRKLGPLRAWVLAGVSLAFVVSVWYLYGIRRCGGSGFPLDDAWIHQTYARNLARTGRWIYASDQVTLGSTSPLWTALLSLGHAVHIPPAPWAYALGILSWLALAWVSLTLTRRLFPEEPIAAPLVGMACLAEWHLAWAALSGLEIVLFALLSLLMIERFAAETHPVWVGLIGGLLVWVRPEGMVLVSLLVVVIGIRCLCSWRRPGRHPGLWRTLSGVVIGFATLWLPYLALNMLVSGRPFPGTFYAKQAEYRPLLARPIWVRLWGVVRPSLVGAQVLLVPGFLWQIVSLLRRIRTAHRSCPENEDYQMPGPDFALMILLPVAWWFVHHLIYALRLPVGYQHGRYLMPTLPILLLYGIVGTTRWVRRSGGTPDRSWVRVLHRALVLALCCLFVAFLILGGRAFAEDVCIIGCEMVDVALWLRDNTPPGALVAAHDIGAIGYWSERPLIDLAGLVTPEVIPFIRDEGRLLAYLVQQGADYVVTFPSWYPSLVGNDRLVPVYRSDCLETRTKGGDNMVVYRIRH
jgi:hypothetical protein